MTRAGLLAALAVVALPAATMASATFFDNTFTAANYSSIGAYTTNGGSISEGTCPSCGISSGPALDFTETVTGSNEATQEGIVNTTWTYNPSTQGAINEVVASVEKELNSTNGLGGLTFSSAFHPVIEQGGNIYIATIAGGTFTQTGTGGYSSGYDLISGELTASDFVLYDFATGTYGVGNPNFSASGGQMTLGLAQFGQSGFPTVFDIDYDDLSYNLAVPEPAAWTLMLIGLGSVGGLMRGRRRTATA